MNRRTTSLAFASLAAASLVMLGSASASAKDHVDVALEFVNNAQGNEWGTPCSITWSGPNGSGASGTTKAACFFTLSLMKAMNYTEKDVYSMWESTSPTSDYYFDLINMSPAYGAPAPRIETFFRRITRAVDIQKGDVIAIGANLTFAGHTMMVAGAPQELRQQIEPRYAGTRQYAVPIVDSTNTSHGCNVSYPDSRWEGQCTGGFMQSGAGTGTVRLYTDSMTGILLGYTWSVTSSPSSYYSPSTRPYRVGRLVKLPEPAGDDLPPPPP